MSTKRSSDPGVSSVAEVPMATGGTSGFVEWDVIPTAALMRSVTSAVTQRTVTTKPFTAFSGDD
jgi:hypothetical protein